MASRGVWRWHAPTHDSTKRRSNGARSHSCMCTTAYASTRTACKQLVVIQCAVTSVSVAVSRARASPRRHVWEAHVLKRPHREHERHDQANARRELRRKSL